MIDRIHGAYLNLADRVVTCDVSFFTVMEHVAERTHIRRWPVLLDKSGPSAITQLRVAVG
jgi:hypothetical protein